MSLLWGRVIVIEAVKFQTSQKDKILKLLETIGDDGHSVWKPSILDDFPEALKLRFVKDYKSDGTLKGTIIKDGQVQDKVTAVWGLLLLQAICDDLNIAYEGYMGRGFQARACTSAIRQFFV